MPFIFMNIHQKLCCHPWAGARPRSAAMRCPPPWWVRPSTVPPWPQWEVLSWWVHRNWGLSHAIMDIHGWLCCSIVTTEGGICWHSRSLLSECGYWWGRGKHMAQRNGAKQQWTTNMPHSMTTCSGARTISTICANTYINVLQRSIANIAAFSPMALSVETNMFFGSFVGSCQSCNQKYPKISCNMFWLPEKNVDRRW